MLTISRFCAPKLVDIEPGLFELFESVSGVRFLRHSVEQKSAEIGVHVHRSNRCANFQFKGSKGQDQG